jgi:multidrug efflux system outer membrane protein
MPRWMLTTVSVLSLSACMMGPDYKKPETPPGDAWRLTPSTAESLANLPWWDLLKDQELQKLVRIALEENLDLRTATASIEEFRAQLVIAKFDIAPSLDYSGNVFGLRNTNNNVIPIGGAAVPSGNQGDGLSLSYESADVGLKWEVDLWGRIRRSIEAARAQLLTQEENQRAVIIGLVGNVAETYFDLRALDLQVDITKRTLKSWEDSVRISKL